MRLLHQVFYGSLLAWMAIVVLSSRDKAADEQRRNREGGAPYSRITKRQTQCEVEALAVGTALTDNYNSLDEGTEWDSRIHSDFMSEYLGFFGIVTQGIWGKAGKTSELRESMKLQKKGKWLGLKNISESAYWALENQWLYMMGDSTQRQVWATFVSPAGGNDFERNSKEWTRENCRRQWPHRKKHPANGVFEDEGWNGKCGNNEVTCDVSGYGKQGKMTFDWKHFPYEDYDEWVLGESGLWGNFIDEVNGTEPSAAKKTDPVIGDNAAAVLEGGGKRNLRDSKGKGKREQQSHRGLLLGDPNLSLLALLEGDDEHVLSHALDHDHDHGHGHGHDHLHGGLHDHDDQGHGGGTGAAGLSSSRSSRKLTDSEVFKGTFKRRPRAGDELRRPDIFVFEVGLHTCFHAWDNTHKVLNEAYILKHEADLPKLFRAITAAITRPTADNSTYPGTETLVIVSTAGRIGNEDSGLDHCSWRWNRQLAIEAHKAGFPVFEREEIERRLLFKSDVHMASHQGKYIKPGMHLAAPSPQIVATSLMAMISCLRRARGDGNGDGNGKGKGNDGLYPYHVTGAGRTIPVHSSADDDKEENKFT